MRIRLLILAKIGNFLKCLFLFILLLFFSGMLNMQALTDIISNQQIKYDFTYYTINYETQIPVLTLSTGKSLLPVSYLGF